MKHSFVNTYHYFCQTLCSYHGGNSQESFFESHNFKPGTLNLIFDQDGFFSLEIHGTFSANKQS